MNIADDGRSRRLSPLRCIFCEQHDADRLDRFVGLPKNGGMPDPGEIREKVFTVPEITDQLFSKTDLEARRNGDINERAAAAKLESMVLGHLLTGHEQIESDGAKLVRICRACWEGAEAGRRPPGLKDQQPYWLRQK